MKKVISLFVVLLIVIASIPFNVSAENIWVCDTEDVLSEKTISYINSLNSDVLSTYKADPKFALVVMDKLPEDYKNYALTLFHEYGMSKIKDSYDVLLIFAIDEKLYHIEAGGGYENGSLINQSLHSSMISEEVLDDLYDKKYDEAVIKIVDYYKSMMEQQDSGEYAIKQAKHDRKVLIMKIIACVVFGTIGVCVVVFYIRNEKKEAAKAQQQNVDQIDKNENDIKVQTD